MRRAWLVAVLAGALTAPACQCFTPVDEGELDDGGRPDAGAPPDAGTPDAGPASCSSPRDCSGPIAVTHACAMTGAADAGFSCIQGVCIPECAPPAGRTCTWGDASHCLICSTQECVSDCPMAAFHRLVVEEIACSQGIAPFPDFGTFDAVRDGGATLCEFSLQNQVSGTVGTLRLLSGTQLQADLPALGGLCVGEWLPTNAIRLVLSCPRCQVSLLGQ